MSFAMRTIAFTFPPGNRNSPATFGTDDSYTGYERMNGSFPRPQRRPRTPAALLLLAGLVCVLVIGGGACERPNSPTTQIPKMRVVATVYPLADVARQVGGPFVDASWIVEGGQSLSGVRSTEELRNRLSNADFVICTSPATEPWATAGSTTDTPQRQRVIRLDLLNSAQQNAVVGLLWLDPVITKDLARELGARLFVSHPDREKYFHERTNEFVVELDSLVQQYQSKFLATRNKKVLVLNTDFNPLLYRFGLEPIQPTEAMLTGLNDTDVAVLKVAARDQGTRLLLAPADLPEAVSKDIASRTGLQIVPIDVLGSSAGGGKTYLDMLKSNLEQLLQAMAYQ
jgi:zinc transport system substrate-binding protein